MKIVLILLGAGTVGYRCLEAVAESPVGRLVKRLIICDHAGIRQANATTCPLYAAHVGEAKCNRLSALALDWFGDSRPRITTQPCRVESLKWDSLLSPSGDGGRRCEIVLVGLDDWGSRLVACEDIRAHAASRAAAGPTLVQIGLDRGQASIAVFGSAYADPCPACGKRTLPVSEPCVVLAERGGLLRGDLRNEAVAAARQFSMIAEDLASPQPRWLNRKANLVIRADRCDVFSRPAERQGTCFGPHAPVGPIRWASHPVNAVEGVFS